jgi:2,4-diaminopentanoate dehydrogenase
MEPTTTRRSWEARAGINAPIRTLVIGLGPVGQAVVDAAMKDVRFDVVGCVDVSAEARSAISELAYDGPAFGAVADADVEADVAVVCTSSTIAGIHALAADLVERGCHVVSSCEELIAPQLADCEVVRSLHETATNAGKVVIGAGVNPGFVMDVLPVLLTIPTLDVRSIEVSRRVNVATRRVRLQEKVGVGIGLDDFARRKSAGEIGHMGLRASLVYLANALGWDGESHETVDAVEAGGGARSLGVRHEAWVADAQGEVRVRGLLEMYAGARDLDEITIHAQPDVRVQIPGGISGDAATVAALLNVAARVTALRPGLATPADHTNAGWCQALVR